MVDERLERLERLARSVPHLPDPAGALPARSWSNDAWLFEDVVLRVCWRGDVERLAREALILEHLPDSVPHPSVLDAGVVDEMTWMVMPRLPGVRLSELWPEFAPEQRGDAVEQLGRALAALHEWDPPSAVRLGLADEHLSAGTKWSDRLIVPLPVARLTELAEGARRSPNIGNLADRVVARLESLADVDPFTGPLERFVLVHGDANLSNVLWAGGRITALLDFEWARMGPPDLEVETFLRYSEPDIADFVGALRAGYPAVFEHPDLVRRLWLYQIAFLFRQTLASAPARGSWLYERLDGVLNGPHHIVALVAAS